MITKKEDFWITEFIPQYTPKGSRLYHRKSSLTPKQRLFSDFFERFRDEGIITSEANQTVTAMQDGFIISFFEKDDKWMGLAYREDLRGRGIELKTPYCPTRTDADRMLSTFIRTYNKNVTK